MKRLPNDTIGMIHEGRNLNLVATHTSLLPARHEIFHPPPLRFAKGLLLKALFTFTFTSRTSLSPAPPIVVGYFGLKAETSGVKGVIRIRYTSVR